MKSRHRQSKVRVAWLLTGVFFLGGGAALGTWWLHAPGLTEIRVLRGHTQMIHAVAVSPDGTHGLTAAGASFVNGVAKDSDIRLWDLRIGAERGRLRGHDGAVFAVSFSPDGKRAVSGGEDRTVRLWVLTHDPIDGRLEPTVQSASAVWSGHHGAVWSVAFSPDGAQVLSASQDTTLILWDVATGKVVRRFEGHKSKALSVQFLGEGRRAVSASADGTARIWDAATGRELACVDDLGPLYSVAAAPDGSMFATAGAHNLVCLHDPETGAVLKSFVGHQGGTLSVAFTPDGKGLVSSGCFDGADHSVRLWDIASGRQLACYRGHVGSVNAVAPAAAGGFVLTAGGDATARLLRLP